MLMVYSKEQIDGLQADFGKTIQHLQGLMTEGHRQSHLELPDGARKQLTLGAGRRLMVIKRAAENIFRLLPPQQDKPLPREVVTDVQINLHAFVVNLRGVFDNWAWAFLYRHDLVGVFARQKLDVSLFKPKLQSYLPEALKCYLTAGDIPQWHQAYLKDYRDSLAHSIPLYIPPALWTKADAARYQELEKEKIELIQAYRWDEMDAVWDEQYEVGRACHLFLHESSADDSPAPILLHPQVLCDLMTVIELGDLFHRSWHECGSGQTSAEK